MKVSPMKEERARVGVAGERERGGSPLFASPTPSLVFYTPTPPPPPSHMKNKKELTVEAGQQPKVSALSFDQERGREERGE